MKLNLYDLRFFRATLLCVAMLFFNGSLKAQISREIYQELPDSVKPANRLRLSREEKRNLLYYGSFLLSRKQVRELLPVAESLERETETQQNIRFKVDNLDAIFTYYFNSDDLHVRALKYCDQILAILDRLPEKEAGVLYWEMITSKGYLLGSANRYEESADLLIRALDHYRLGDDSTGIADVSMYLAQTYYELDLYEWAIAQAQRARTFLKRDNFWKQRDMQIQAEIARYMTAICHRQGGNQCEAGEQLFKSVLRDTSEQSVYWRSYCYAFLSWNRYLKKDYRSAIAYSDSALDPRWLEFEPNPMEIRNRAVSARGLSQMALGMVKEGAGILKSVISSYDSAFASGRKSKTYQDVAKVLYEQARQAGNWKEALIYYEKYKTTEDSVDIIDNRGKLVVAQQKYDVSVKDARIRNLEFDQRLNKERQNRNLLLMIAMVLLALSLALLLFNRQRKNKIRSLEAARAMQEEKRVHNEALVRLEHNMVRLQQDAVMLQRKKISDDMHDDISSSLAGLRFYIADIKAGALSDEVKSAMSDIEQEVTTIYQNARQYMHSLKQNTQLQYDLAAYLTELKIKMAENATLFLDVQFNAQEIKTRLSADQHYHLYHILREAIANIVKHASANRAFVHVEVNDESCRFVIGDNGKGFDPAAAALNPGLGLQSLERRVRDMDGYVKVQSGTRGTIIRGEFPLYPGLEHKDAGSGDML